MKDKIAKKILRMEKDKLMSEPEYDRDWELITALDLAIEALNRNGIIPYENGESIIRICPVCGSVWDMKDANKDESITCYNKWIKSTEDAQNDIKKSEDKSNV